MHNKGGVLMNRNVRIIARDGEAFVRLWSDILGLLPRRAAGYSWWILELYGEGDVSPAVRRTMKDVTETIDHDGALAVSWTELNELAHAMTQVFDLVVVGIDSEHSQWHPVKELNFDELCIQCDVVIQAFDSSEWRMCGRDEVAVDSIAALTSM